MLKGATIVFDIDGTLIDTAPDLTNALNHVLSARGHHPVAPEVVRAAAGRGARAMIEEALRLARVEDDVDGMLAGFLAHYEANIATETRPFPGALEALDRLAAAGARLAVCTNKRERLTRMLLQALEIEDYFAALAGRDTFPVSKPDPGHLLGVIATAGGDPSRALIVGDSAVDIHTAQGAHVPSILVSFGYAPPPPDGPRPDAVIGHFDELQGSVLSLFRGLTTRSGASS
jgi:phosphoglycolate phosphatase